MKQLNTKLMSYIFFKRFLLHAFCLWLLINIAGWLIYLYKVKFDLAYTINQDGSPVSFTDNFINQNIKQPLCLWILLVACLSEFNFKFVFTRKNLLWFMACSIFWGIVGGGISLLFTKHYTFYPLGAQFIESALFLMVYVAGYSILVDFFYERYREAKLGQKRSESELHLLKSQINPHFFFNTLNNLYGIALSENAIQTAGAIELMADMMRYNMEGNKENFISVSEEIKFIENYLQLQQLRIPKRDNITITTVIEYPKSPVKIAPMLLIPLIENAWKYGISMDRPSYINLKITTHADELSLFIENSVFANHAKNTGSGLGIANVRQRLQLIYPGKHKLAIESEEQRFRVKLIVGFNQ